LKYLLRPDDHWNVLVEADYVQESGPGNSVIDRRFDAPGGFIAGLDQQAGITASPTNLQLAANGPTFNNFTVGGTQANVSYSFDNGMSLTDVVAYRSYTDSSNGDFDFLPESVWDITAVQRDYTQFSNELRLASAAGSRLEYQVGTYYLHLKALASTQQALNLQGLLPPAPEGITNLGSDFRPQSWNTSVAAFGQAAFHITDQLRLRGGVRETYDDVRFSDDFLAQGHGYVFAAPLYPLVPFDNRTYNTNFSYRGGVEYDIQPDIMAYVTYARGYKGPTFDQLNGHLVNPEIPNDLELGLKATLFDRRLSLNVAVFDEKFHQFQAQAQEPGGATGFETLNAGDLTSRGVEAEFRAWPVIRVCPQVRLRPRAFVLLTTRRMLPETGWRMRRGGPARCPPTMSIRSPRISTGCSRSMATIAVTPTSPRPVTRRRVSAVTPLSGRHSVFRRSTAGGG
jgi:iron complex outermembrane receptor protein